VPPAAAAPPARGAIALSSTGKRLLTGLGNVVVAGAVNTHFFPKPDGAPGLSWPLNCCSCSIASQIILLIRVLLPTNSTIVLRGYCHLNLCSAPSFPLHVFSLLRYSGLLSLVADICAHNTVALKTRTCFSSLSSSLSAGNVCSPQGSFAIMLFSCLCLISFSW
jgi:hypothetical protein